jgi:ribosomal protein S18 acetylase RimI-like enzyme
MPNVEIARLGPNDWPELKIIRLEALQREPAAYSSTYADSVHRPDEDWRRRLVLPGSVTLVARSDGLPIGMAGAILGVDGEREVAMIVGMYVNAAHRRRGVGRLLLRALLAEIAAHPEITTTRLWVTPTQEAARRFYASLGFREIANPDSSMLEGPGAHEEIAMERPVSKEKA